jgi:hypothetical protein
MTKPLLWPPDPPPECPLPPSSDLGGIAYTGRHTSYTEADTWYPSWAADGALYSPFTDGKVGRWSVGSVGLLAATGHAKITGDDPMELTVEALGSEFASPGPYGGRYPSASLVKDGVWYYGTYCVSSSRRGLNWDVLGPLVGFRVSRDFGLTWQDCPHTAEAPLFGESGLDNGKVKIGTPHFVDFGQEMEHSPDGKAYLVGHGGSDSHADTSWISGDEIYLVRVDATPDTINDPAAYEFFDGQGWTRDFTRMRPLIRWPGHTGCVTVTYNAPLGKYLMCVTDGWPTTRTMSSYVLEADDLVGPWRLVTYMRDFGTQAYFLNFPSKFISSDGTTLWLMYSANYTEMAREAGLIDYNGADADIYPNPPGSKYAMVVQEVQLLTT